MMGPIGLDHFKPCIEWWCGLSREGRVENEAAWCVGISEITARGFNLDFKNPHVVQDDHGDPDELLAELVSARKRSEAVREQLRAALESSLLR